TLKELVGALRERPRTFEVLVVENGSIDTTLADARAFADHDPVVSVLTRPRPDYGAAMRAGILAATGDVVVVFDVDYYDAEFV
ncbi:glycosyltransferase, partial [Klebsiella pneumoniae]